MYIELIFTKAEKRWWQSAPSSAREKMPKKTLPATWNPWVSVDDGIPKNDLLEMLVADAGKHLEA